LLSQTCLRTLRSPEIQAVINGKRNHTANQPQEVTSSSLYDVTLSFQINCNDRKSARIESR
jgi:hypothetical protein